MRINAHKAHRRLWNWLANNPGEEKYCWPEWKENGGAIPHVRDRCFACAITGDGACKECPIEWPGSGFCAGDDDDLFCIWCGTGTPESRVEIAKRIANLPWKGPKMLEVKGG